jgi:phage baseplate assembly protein W
MADQSVPYISRVPDYCDIDLDFMKHPKTNQLILKHGRDAVIRSVRNLVFTNYYERPFKSGIGSNIRALLFENFTPTTLLVLQDEIRRVLNEFEPRIEVQDIRASEDIDRNGFDITIEFVILNRNEPVVTTVFLERIR